MAKGLVKAKEYDWKDSNLALFGSDVEKNVKKESAEAEPAWSGAGKRCGLKIWRIEQFKVKAWKSDDYGKFYDGDSFIILNTYQKPDSDEFLYDVHFWIGKHSTQDEYGAAAYKTVELDTYLDDKPVQHREVMGHESNLFKSYFPTLEILNGGVKSGFKHVQPRDYKPRLLRIRRTESKCVIVKEVDLVRSSLDSDDVFILDMGLTLYQWNGSGSNKDERYRASEVMRGIKSERGKAKTEVYDEDGLSKEHAFYKFFPNKQAQQQQAEVQDDSQVFGKALFRLSDKGGSLKLSEVARGNISLNKFNSNDVFILDIGCGVYVWIGANASANEKRNAMSYGHNYVSTTKHPFAPITCIREGGCNDEFYEALN